VSDRGILVVISGPSGVGKTTVVDRVLAKAGYVRAVTATTRAPREGEVNGRDYVFLDRDDFLSRVARDEFLEHATVHGNLYGTPRAHVTDILERGGVCVLSVDVQGAAQIRGKVGPARFLFIGPPSLEVLEARLRGRGTEDRETADRRLDVARAELARQDEYDRIVVNDDLDRAVEEVTATIEEWRAMPSADEEE
jgi:guanylate kinase